MKDNKKLRIVLDIILIVVGFVFLGFAIKDAVDMYNDSKITDNIRFYKDYRSVGEDNIYKYISIKDANKLKSGVLLIGTPNDSWTQILVKPLNDIVSSYDKDIYYLEKKDLDKEDKNYKDFLINLDENTEPCILVIDDEKIVLELSKGDIFDKDFDGAPIEYFEEKSTDKLKDDLSIISDLK